MVCMVAGYINEMLIYTPKLALFGSFLGHFLKMPLIDWYAMVENNHLYCLSLILCAPYI